MVAWTSAFSLEKMEMSASRNSVNLPALHRHARQVVSRWRLRRSLATPYLAGWRRSVEHPRAGANIERHKRIDLCRLDHDINVDLLIARTDAPPARTYLDCRNAQFVI